MRAPHPSSDLFCEKRKNLIKTLKPASLALVFSADEYPKNGDQFFPFRQNSDLYQLSGIDQEETILMIYISKSKEVEEWLFIKQINEKQRIWHGDKYTTEQAATYSGISNALWVSEFETILVEKLPKIKNIYTLSDGKLKSFDDCGAANSRRKVDLVNTFPEKKHLDLAPYMLPIRLIKNSIELDYIRQAVEITRRAYHDVLSKVSAGMKEYEVEALITHRFIAEGAEGHAYEPIVASGKNACILHYVNNDQVLKEEDLLLLDFGAEYGLYAADCSRTIPISGQFSARQAQIYNAVLRVFNKAKTLYIPGNTIDIINEQVGSWMNEELINLGLYTSLQLQENKNEEPLYKKYFMHGTAHFIGLDVHDTGTKSTPFERGMVLSCEPAIYIEEEGVGVRIETDILVAEEPIDLMHHFPITVEEIEAAMLI